MLKWFIEGVGWIGAALILGSYALLTMRRLNAESATYQWMNIAGATGMIVNGLSNGALPSAFLNVIWLGLGAFALWRGRAGR